MPSFTQGFVLNAQSAAFADNFNTLSLYNTRNVNSGPFDPAFSAEFSTNTSAALWEPSYWYSVDGIVVNDSWIVNPFNPATPIADIYTVSNNLLSIQCKTTPPQFAAACSNKPQVAGILTTQPTFRQNQGYFEARLQVQKLQGMGAAFWLFQDATSAPEIDIIEITWPNGNDPVGVFTLIDTTGTVVATNFTYNVLASYDPTVMHQYGLEWKASDITWYIDRQPLFQAPTPPGFTMPLFPILMWNSGGSFSGSIINTAALPVFMTVDYVYVWPSKPF